MKFEGSTHFKHVAWKKVIKILNRIGQKSSHNRNKFISSENERKYTFTVTTKPFANTMFRMHEAAAAAYYIEIGIASQPFSQPASVSFAPISSYILIKAMQNIEIVV